MTEEEAKELLILGPPSDPDGLHRYQQAEALLRESPVMQQVIDEIKRRDVRIQVAMQSIPVPPSLKAATYEACGLQPDTDRPTSERQTYGPSSRRPRRMFYTLAFATGIAAAFLIFTSLWPRIETYRQDQYNKVMYEMTQYREALAYYAAGGYIRLNYTATTLPELHAWLRTNAPKFPRTSIEGLPAEKMIGCQTLDWHCAHIALLCFANEKDELIHLFTTYEDAIPPRQRGDSMTGITRLYGRETFAWSDPRTQLHHVLVASEAHVELAPYLPAGLAQQPDWTQMAKIRDFGRISEGNL